MTKVSELAKMIDHSILNPVMTDNDLKRECEVAKKYNVASVCVKPYAVRQAVELLKGFRCTGWMCDRISSRKQLNSC